MEKKRISGKWIGILAAIVLALAAVVVFFIMKYRKSENSYRSIQIYDLEGTATIERENIGSIKAIENLYLESGDRIIVDDNSFMRLKLDDDKFIVVEENSVLSIVAEGTKKNSKTSIKLEKGSIINEIQNKLNKKSSYDVSTPNSVMAVRGTVFRVEVTFDESGEVYTKVSTFEGKVGTRLILPDNTIENEVAVVEGGKEVIIHMDNEKTEYLSDIQNIDYSELPVPALEFLKSVMENGTVLVGIQLDEIESLIEQKSDNNDEDRKEETKVFTVTFIYGDEVFGTQKVEEGQKVTVPKLAPEENGEWDYDFEEPITGDTTISWK